MTIKVSKKSINDVDDVWIHENLLPPAIMANLKAYLMAIKDQEKFNFEGRTITHNNSHYKLVGTNHYRPYQKLWDLSQTKEYWDQTSDTIYDWANENYRRFMHPSIRLLAEKIKSVEPFKGKKWVVVRGILNILEPGVELGPHHDSNQYIYDFINKDLYSATYYIDVEDSEGGEFWDERGFMHKPKNNELLVNIGNKYYHGVRPSNKFRLGMTMRFYEPQDLILGDIDSLLYKPEWL